MTKYESTRVRSTKHEILGHQTMGGFYGSVQVRSEDRNRVRQVAEEVAKTKGIKCLLGPAIRGWIGIYPDGNGQDQTIGKEIARHLDCDVLHILVVHDDVMAYWLWRNKELVDSYWSDPGCFGEDVRSKHDTQTGRPEIFAPLSPRGTEPLREVLQRDQDRFALEYARLAEFAEVLGIANAVTAYEYLKQGETDEIQQWEWFEELPVIIPE